MRNYLKNTNTSIMNILRLDHACDELFGYSSHYTIPITCVPPNLIYRNTTVREEDLLLLQNATVMEFQCSLSNCSISCVRQIDNLIRYDSDSAKKRDVNYFINRAHTETEEQTRRL